MCDTRNLGRSNIRRQEQGILNCDKNGVIKLQWKGIKKTKKPAEGTKKPIEVDKTKNQNQQHQYPEHLSGVSGMTNFTLNPHAVYFVLKASPNCHISYTRRMNGLRSPRLRCSYSNFSSFLSIFKHSFLTL